MAWQGIPFRIPFETNEFISLALNSIPKMTMKVETDTDHSGLLLTAGAALVGGIIPAIIAAITFWINARNVRIEREAQQIFLRDERQSQQDFLKDERVAQSASLEADRDAQLLIASKNFNMQVLSVNRQAWINSFRDLIAEYCALTNKDLAFSAEYKTQEKAYEDNSAAYEKNKKTEDAVRNYNKRYEEYADSMQKLEDIGHSIDHLKYKIEMMLNPSEEDSNNIKESMKRLRIISADYGRDNKGYHQAYKEIFDEIGRLTLITQQMLKKEWDRVKKGH